MENPKKLMEKQGYRFPGKHSAVKICEWTKKSLINKGFCYKQKFYGIKSHRCCQVSPWILCQNKCIHCWRPIELEIEKSLDNNCVDNPEFIIDESIKMHRKLLSGFNGNEKANIKKFKESQEPMQFAISLIGEPILYPFIGEFIEKLRKRRKTSFVVTNGLQPEILKKLGKNKQLPTQIYLSLNSPNKEHYEKWHRSSDKNAWKKLNETLKIFPELKTRKVIRMTLVKELNDNKEYVKNFAKLILKAKPDFIEIKSYMAIGFSRARLGYEKMLSHEEIKDYAKQMINELNSGYKILSEHKLSRVVLIGKDKEKMKIQKSEI
jgi:tRNA wybutosine-synthesizing protein 1